MLRRHSCLQRTKYLHVEFEVLTAVVMKSSNFWDITPCSPLKVNCSACHLLSHWFLVRLILDPEDGGDMFLRNVG
jgi:hypothetical protein